EVARPGGRSCPDNAGACAVPCGQTKPEPGTPPCADPPTRKTETWSDATFPAGGASKGMRINESGRSGRGYKPARSPSFLENPAGTAVSTGPAGPTFPEGAHAARVDLRPDPGPDPGPDPRSSRRICRWP